MGCRWLSRVSVLACLACLAGRSSIGWMDGYGHRPGRDDHDHNNKTTNTNTNTEHARRHTKHRLGDWSGTIKQRSPCRVQRGRETDQSAS